MHELIGDITLSILLAWVLGLLAYLFRQPLILAHLIAGFFIGPFGTGWVKSQEIHQHHLRRRRSALRIGAGAGARVRLLLPAQE